MQIIRIIKIYKLLLSGKHYKDLDFRFLTFVRNDNQLFISGICLVGGKAANQTNLL